MIQIYPDQVTSNLSTLFSLSIPTGIRALAVLAGGNAGKIFTDDPLQPHWGLVWEADDGTLYHGGNINRSILLEAVEFLRQEGIVALGFREGDPFLGFFPPDPDAGAECIEFDRPIGISDLTPFLGPLPLGFSVHRMDQTLLEHSPKYAENLNRYGSIENFLTRGIAVCIMHGNETVCEAYADMDILGTREIGVTTQPAYRRQGFAACACAHLIQLCESAGSQTYWDCVRLNVGSRTLARKLGFKNERAYKLLAWFRNRE